MPRLPRVSRSNLLIGAIIVVALAIGTYYRFTGQNWDDYTHLHPDERYLTGVIDSLAGPLQPSGSDADQADQTALCKARYPNSNGVADSVFDSQCSTWNPFNANSGGYSYGQLPLFVVKAASEFTYLASTKPDCKVDANTDCHDPNWLHYNGIQFVGRSVSAIADLISCFFIFLIGRRLYNKWVGVLALTLYAAAVFPIQLSHYWTTDAFTNLPVVIGFWFATRAMDRARWYDFVGFGVALGASVATRINTLFLFGIIGLAAIVYALPALDMSLPGRERWRLISRAAGGVIIAVLIGFMSFRVMNPDAFTGGPGIVGFFNVIPYGPWLKQLSSSQALATGNVDFPPNHQWTSRPSYIFPLRNIILWGLGVPLGLAAWLGWLWAALQILRARPLWTRHILPVTWILVYFGYMGRQWVMTMRYYINLYPFLVLLGAWALYEIATRSYRWMQRNPVRVRRLVAIGGGAVLVGVVALTFLWATMFVHIFQRQLTRVEATRWVQLNLPSSISMTVKSADASTQLVNFQIDNTPDIRVTAYQTLKPQIVQFTGTPDTTVTQATVKYLSDPSKDGKTKHFTVAIATDQGGAQLVTQGMVTGDFAAPPGTLGGTYTVKFDQPLVLTSDKNFYLVSWSDAPVNVARQSAADSEFVLQDSTGKSVAQVMLPSPANDDGNGVYTFFGTVPALAQTSMTTAGTVSEIDITHLLNPLHDGSKLDLNVKLIDGDNQKVLGQGELQTTADSTATSVYGDPYVIKLDQPATVAMSEKVQLEITSSAPAQVVGTAIAWEGDWDDPVPWSVCPVPPGIPFNHDTPSGLSTESCEAFGGLGTWYKESKMQMALEDDDSKRQIMTQALDTSDYLIITSNRFYDSLSRLPTRFPMSINYYNALFSGQLGFDLAKLVTSFPSIGNFEIADQNLPIWNSPKWVNEWESEEAFSVYDHPTVFIYKKTPKFSPELLADVLNVQTTSADSIDTTKTQDTTLINRITWIPLQASAAPTGFMMTPDLRVIQTQGASWSDLFNRTWAINTSPVLAVVAWWIVFLILGFAAWPILFVLLPGLPDRGYPMAKIAGLLILAWIAWAGGTIRLLTWSQVGLLLILIGLVAVGLIVAIRNRAQMMDYVRLNWRHLVIVELITLMLFLGFLVVKLGNPDLWAQTLGGEKPMDFAYLNAVLRSTVFPPYDPWFAGGYINYYYFGFVLVGAPVKLLGIMPSEAYNLIIPALYAMTGMGAFSVAFNVVASRWFFPRDEGSDRNDPSEPVKSRRRFALRTPAASPYLAGVLALLLCIVLGNLDTPRTFVTGLAGAGGYRENPDMLTWKVNEFILQNGRQPTADENAQLANAVVNPSASDKIAFSIYNVRSLVSSIGSGVSQLLGGGLLPISPDRWFWGPTRIIGELPDANNEINEMPYFTFVFADLHAHMIALPLTLLALGIILAEILAAGTIRRSTFVVIAATVFAGLVVGSLQPTNTWDWPTYLMLMFFGLTFAAFLRRTGLNRKTVLQWVGQLALFFAAQAIAALPFTAFWATYLGTSAFKGFDGNKTPIWAFLDIHGIFLYAVVSLLVWQTLKLLRRMYVRDFVGKAWPLVLLAVVVGFTTLITLFLSFVPIHIWLFYPPMPVAIICVPLLLWCGVLFLVPEQSREMRFIYAITGVAVGAAFGPEIIVLGADIGRQNTIFKYYMQAWILFSVASGVGLAWLIHESQRWTVALRGVWLAFLALLLSVAGLFPIMATQGKIAMRMAPNAPHSLDGQAYMDYATYQENFSIPMSDDLKVIHWLEDNVQGSPVILEAQLTEYRYGSRFSINTGLPTIVGWNFHQRQQRTIDPLPNLVFERVANVAGLYNTTDINIAWTMLNFFNVKYIIVNKLEQSIYDPAGLAKFDTMVNQGLLKVVYNQDYDTKEPDNNGVLSPKHVMSRIYELVPGATLNNITAGG